ncbi:MAG: GMC oxidoreductase [Halioglobus sp.]
MGNIKNQSWDYIVIGTGMGGATAGLELARRGASVLFLEMGQSHLDSRHTLSGNFAETFLDSQKMREQPDTHRRETLISAGRYCRPIEDSSNPAKPKRFIPFIGSGTGGSTALYGMALERFFPADFQGGTIGAANASDDQWPLSYSDIAPYYASAETLFRVRGGQDPLREATAADYAAAPPLSNANELMSNALAAKGLHPYQLPMACEFVPDCATCQSYLCTKGCKVDASVCVRLAVDNHRAELLDHCEVTLIEANEAQATAVQCTREGETFTLSANRLILAAGALETPSLLLRSTSAAWPNGLANQNDQVGRNLMRHYVDLYAVFTSPKPNPSQRTKEIAFNDFYLRGDEKLGSVQSFGLLPPAKELADEIASDVRHTAGAIAGALFKVVKPLVALVLGQIFSRTLILASTLEDQPFDDNRVTLKPAKGNPDKHEIHIHYVVRDSEKSRIEKMRTLMKTALKPMRFLLLKQAENNERLAHVCGTARMGHNPKTSVCDENQKAHGIDNLYIADGSVFPSSGGINPSLTIAALSLRLAKHLEANENV